MRRTWGELAAEMPSIGSTTPRITGSTTETLHLAVEKVDPRSPYSWVRYTFRRIEERGFVTISRRARGGVLQEAQEVLSETARVDDARWAEMQKELSQCGLTELSDAKPDFDLGSTWFVEWEKGDATGDFMVQAPGWLESGHATCLLMLESLALEHVVMPPLFPIFTADSERGFAHFYAEPVSEIFLDGVALGLTTPQDRIPLPAGRHEVRFVSLDGEKEHTFSFVVEVGVVTVVESELR